MQTNPLKLIAFRQSSLRKYTENMAGRGKLRPANPLLKDGNAQIPDLLLWSKKIKEQCHLVKRKRKNTICSAGIF